MSDAKLPLPPNVHLDSFQISENMKCTAALSGATFVQPACIDYEGKKALVFPFSVRISSWSKVCSHMTRAPMQDLAVKIEGRLLPPLSHFRSLCAHGKSSRYTSAG